MQQIRIRGAREHNLKNIDLEIPRDRLVVFTGLSGSGKSSLAFDTIYAEGQRRYVESLSAYARQFLEMMQKPDVDQIDGLSPAISIEQKTTSRNPRSTVGTVTEIYDYMRLLWARVGVPYSPATGLPIESQTVSQMVDRIVARPDIATRLADSLEQALKLADGLAIAEMADGGAVEGAKANKQRNETAERLIFSEKFACPVSGFTIPEVEPRLFSFNNPFGACPKCGGLGVEQQIDPDLVVHDKERTLRGGAISPWAKS